MPGIWGSPHEGILADVGLIMLMQLTPDENPPPSATWHMQFYMVMARRRYHIARGKRRRVFQQGGHRVGSERQAVPAVHPEPPPA